MPRFLSAQPSTRLIPLPWNVPLAEWPVEYLVALPRGISRHVVRFIRVGEDVYAAKEVIETAALHEYRMLQDLHRDDTPAVEPLAVVTGRRDLEGERLDPVLLTRHLSYSLPYRSLFNSGVRPDTVGRLLDALVVLLVRLHLIGFLWLDVSLSNVLFRRDAGEFAAYLVDAETGEMHDHLTDGQRAHDLQIATTNLFGEFCDLEAGRMLDASLSPEWLVESILARYHALWDELTGVEEYAGDELFRIEGRVRRLNALGFDVAELEVDTAADGSTLRIQPKVVDAGHHSRRLLRLTGLDTEENQARRLLNDLDTWRYHNNLQGTDEGVAAHRWLTEAFHPVIAAVPNDLAGKRDDAQLYHELLDYRWYESERQGREVPLTEAVHGYVRDVLSGLPDEVVSSDAMATVEGGRTLANPYDPSQGFEDDEGPMPDDPWETGEEVVVNPYLDISSFKKTKD